MAQGRVLLGEAVYAWEPEVMVFRTGPPTDAYLEEAAAVRAQARFTVVLAKEPPPPVDAAVMPAR